jgi:hypothetical protein
MPNQIVTGSFETLMRQAPDTILEYVVGAKRIMGDAWCEKNPEAMATLVLAMSNDYHSGCVVIASQNIESALFDINNQIMGLVAEIGGLRK